MCLPGDEQDEQPQHARPTHPHEQAANRRRLPPPSIQ